MRGLNLRPLEPPKTELPFYPLGHASPTFFELLRETDYIKERDIEKMFEFVQFTFVFFLRFLKKYKRRKEMKVNFMNCK